MFSYFDNNTLILSLLQPKKKETKNDRKKNERKTIAASHYNLCNTGQKRK